MSKIITFLKYSSCGNKFVMIDETAGPLLTETEKMSFAYQATDIYFGVGSDNFLVIQPCKTEILEEINEVHHYWDTLPDPASSDYIFRMFEPDGKEAFSCGNGLICISNYLYHAAGIESARIMTEIPTSVPKVIFIGTDVEKRMNWANIGRPKQIPPEMMAPDAAVPFDDRLSIINKIQIPFSKSELLGVKDDVMLELSGYAVFTGEPHFVVFTDSGISSKVLSEQILKTAEAKRKQSKTDYSSWIVHEIGMALNNDYSHWFPSGLNVNFVRVFDKNGVLEQRTFERGVYRETWACGTGAVAASFTARHLNMILGNNIKILPYLSRLRDPGSHLMVNRIGEDYYLSGRPVFIFKGATEYRSPAVPTPCPPISDSNLSKDKNETHSSKFLYGDSFTLGGNRTSELFHFPVPIDTSCEWLHDIKFESGTRQTEKKTIPEILHTYISTIAARLELIAGILILLLVVFGFNALLSTGSLKKGYLNTVVTQYRSIGMSLQTILKDAIHQGKDITAIAESNALLMLTKDRILHAMPVETRVSVSVASKRKIINSTDLSLIGSSLPPIKGSFSYDKQSYITELPVSGELVVAIAFGDKQIRTLQDSVFKITIKTISIILALSALFLILILNIFIFGKVVSQDTSKKFMVSSVFLVVVISQIVFSLLSIQTYITYTKQVGVNYAQEILAEQIKSVYLDAATVIVISIFFFVELLIVFSRFIEKRIVKHIKKETIHYSAIRPVFFLLMFGFNISISFVPLHMETLYEPFLGLSKNFILSLPVSISVFFTGIAFFIAGIWNDRRGWHEPFFAGSFLACAGLLYAWSAPNSFHFILSRVVSGTGYGLYFMASQGFIIAYSDKDTKARGFASLFAAVYAGIICGSNTGAMLAERIGYKPVFLIGAMIIFSSIICTVLFMKNTIKKPELAANYQKFEIKKITRFLVDRNVLSIILFSSIPANMAMIGFLEYFNPMYLSRLGVSQSNIGRTFMLYCVFMIFIGPLISRFVDASEKKKLFIGAGGLLGGISFIAFNLFEGIPAILAAIFFLGFSQSFVYVAHAAYLLKMKITKETGDGKAIAAFRLVNRFGQAAGPMIFSALIAAADIHKSVAYVGWTYLVLTGLLLLISQTDKKIVSRT